MTSAHFWLLFIFHKSAISGGKIPLWVKRAVYTHYTQYIFFLVDLIADPENQENKELMAAVTGAIWKCATGNNENVQR